MKNFPKAGLLIVTLVIPALIFMLLKLFATNHYDLPHYLPERDSVGNIKVQDGDTLFRKVADNCPAFDSTVFTGALTVIHYLPATCDDSCKLGIAELERIAALNTEIGGLRILTVANEGQKSEVEIPANQLGWKVARGTTAEIDSCFKSELGIDKIPDTLRSLKDLVLVDQAGHVRGYYKGGNREETDRLMAEIKILEYEKKNK